MSPERQWCAIEVTLSLLKRADAALNELILNTSDQRGTVAPGGNANHASAYRSIFESPMAAAMPRW